MFQNTNGQFSMWVMNQTNFVHYASIVSGPAAATGWRVAAFADLNKDNNVDVLWQNTNGNIMTWLMHGTNFMRRHFLSTGAAASTGWKIYAATDLTGDGRADLLWRNNNGALKYWQMNGTNYVGEFSLRAGQPASSGLTIAGTADLDGNGSADIVWANTNGANAVWLMNQTNYLRTVGLRSGYPASNGWKLSLLTDLNSDRKTDFVWEKNDGRLDAWLMNGTNFVRTVTLRTNAGAISGWRVVGPK
jgi:hypothetical protein